MWAITVDDQGLDGVVQPECQGCKSNELITINAKCSDLFYGQYKNLECDGYVPMDIGIGGSDYIDFTYCLTCGQIQGLWPVEPDFDDGDWE